MSQFEQPAPPAAVWPGPWPDASQPPIPPAWYYLPPWFGMPQTEAQRPTYSADEAAPAEQDRSTVSLPLVLNVHEAAEYLKVCDETVYNLVYREDFPAFRIGRIWRIDAQRLGEWVSRQKTH